MSRPCSYFVDPGDEALLAVDEMFRADDQEERRAESNRRASDWRLRVGIGIADNESEE